MRRALDTAGFERVKIVYGDSGAGFAVPIVEAMVAGDKELEAAIHAFGYHGGPIDGDPGEAKMLPAYLQLDQDSRPRIWASEDGNLPSDKAGAILWGQVQNNNWLNMNVTATVRWSLVWSAYPGVECDGSGMIRADSPWSGHYQSPAPNLAMAAHTTFFTNASSAKWRPLNNGSGSDHLPLFETYEEHPRRRLQTPPLPKAECRPGATPDEGAAKCGTFVTYVEDGTNQWSSVIETLAVPPNHSVTVLLQPSGMLAPASVRLYESRLSAATPELAADTMLLRRQPDLNKTPHGYELTVVGGRMLTVTTLPALPEAPPTPIVVKPPGVFPMPFEPDLEMTPHDQIPRFMTQYEGSFSIVNDTNGGKRTLKQWVRQKPIEWHCLENPPLAFFAPGERYATFRSHGS